VDRAELERVLTRVAQLAATARERMDQLIRQVEQVKAGLSNVVTALGHNVPVQPAARKSKPDAEVSQVEVVFK